VDVRKLDILNERVRVCLESAEYRDGAAFRDMTPRTYNEVESLVANLESDLPSESVIEPLQTGEMKPSKVNRRMSGQPAMIKLAYAPVSRRGSFTDDSRSVSSNAKDAVVHRRHLYWRRDLLYTAQILFTFFLPIQFTSHIASKY